MREDDIHLKVDKRYRESEYFLEDQLRYAESVQDFRSVRDAIMNWPPLFKLDKLALKKVLNID